MKRGIVIAVLVSLMIFPLVSASLQHGILGFVQNADNGASPNGAVVTFMIYRGDENYCNLTDIVGPTGNSKLSNWYSQDIGNCKEEWKAGDIVYVDIVKGSFKTNASYVLTANGSDQMPSVQFISSGINAWIIILIILVIILLMIIISLIIKRKQKFKYEQTLKKK